MRWFRHLSTAADDPVMTEFLDKHGASGWGIWWRIIELIAARISPDSPEPVLRISARNLAAFCRSSTAKVKKVVDTLEVHGKLIVSYDGNYLEINCPKILKYCDEWTQRLRSGSRDTPESLPSNSRTKGSKGKGSKENIKKDALGSASDGQPALSDNGKGEFLDLQNDEDLKVIQQLQALGHPISARMPRATAELLLSRRAPDGAKF